MQEREEYFTFLSAFVSIWASLYRELWPFLGKLYRRRESFHKSRKILYSFSGYAVKSETVALPVLPSAAGAFALSKWRTAFAVKAASADKLFIFHFRRLRGLWERDDVVAGFGSSCPAFCGFDCPRAVHSAPNSDAGGKEGNSAVKKNFCVGKASEIAHSRYSENGNDSGGGKHLENKIKNICSFHIITSFLHLGGGGQTKPNICSSFWNLLYTTFFKNQ